MAFHGRHIVTKNLGGALWLVRVGGEHDLSTVPELRRTVDEIFETGTCLVVDLSSATFIDSSILGELIRAKLQADKSPDETIAVVAPPGSSAGRILDLVGADDKWFPRFDSAQTAIGWCRGNRVPVEERSNPDA